MKKKLLLLCHVILIVQNISALPEPYNSIKVLPFKNHGWFGKYNQENLENIIKKIQPKVVVEVGSWLGKSTLFMAAMLKKEARLYAVDTWQGSIEHENRPDWAEMLPTLYQQFLSNVIHSKLTKIIVPVRMTSLEAAQALDLSPELIYVDASHEEDNVYHDVLAWYEKLKPGGILCGDDWKWQSVRNGVTRAAQELGIDEKDIFTDHNFWQFTSKKSDH